MANNNNIYKMSNAGGFKSLTRYWDMLAGNTVWNPWEPQGAYDALATVTVPSGGAATVTFAGIPTGYKHLQIRGITKNGSSAYILLRYNSDSTTNYTWHSLSGDGSSAGTGSSATGTFTGNPITQSAGGGTSVFSGIVVDILDYANTNKNKVHRTLVGFDNNGSGTIGLTSGMYLSTNAITSITFALSSGSFTQYSQFALYGVK